jgi:biotin-dependent carboxylase-like uncharacterized protein
MIKDLSFFSILKTGPGTSIQDHGRIAFGKYGIPISGAMDSISMNWVNHLLKNPGNEAVLEISQPGLKIKFDAPTLICIAGAKATISINEKIAPSEGLISIDFGDVLEIGAITIGARVFIGFKYGLRIPEILNSKSSYSGITEIGMLKKGDKVGYFSDQELPTISRAKVKFRRDWMESDVIEAYPGPEWKGLNQETQSLILSTNFTLSSQQNRMAFQLEELIPNKLPELSTAPVYPGTIQLTSGGKIIVLMKDAQVTGGYPRILQLPEKSISQIAQKRPNEKIVFKIIEF